MDKTKKKSKSVYVIAFFVIIAVILLAMLIFYKVRYPLKYNEYIAKYSNEYSLSPMLVASLINEESSFKSNAVSKMNAIGLMQISPSTGKYIAEKLGDQNFDTSDLFDPETNIKYGCYYLNYLRNKFEDVTVYLSAYNAGETTVSLWLNNKEVSMNGQTLDRIPYNATKIYTERIINGMRHYKGRL